MRALPQPTVRTDVTPTTSCTTRVRSGRCGFCHPPSGQRPRSRPGSARRPGLRRVCAARADVGLCGARADERRILDENARENPTERTGPWPNACSADSRTFSRRLSDGERAAAAARSLAARAFSDRQRVGRRNAGRRQLRGPWMQPNSQRPRDAPEEAFPCMSPQTTTNRCRRSTLSRPTRGDVEATEEMGEASFPASDPPASWTWDVAGRPPGS